MEDYIDRMQVIGVNTFLNKLLTATILLLLVAKVSLLTENSCEKNLFFNPCNTGISAQAIMEIRD